MLLHKILDVGNLPEDLLLRGAAVDLPAVDAGLEGQGVVTTSDVPLYIRFLDMKAKGNNKIYNRVIFGVMGEARRRIQYGYTDEIAEQVRKQLVEAGATLR